MIRIRNQTTEHRATLIAHSWFIKYSRSAHTVVRMCRSLCTSLPVENNLLKLRQNSLKGKFFVNLLTGNFQRDPGRRFIMRRPAFCPDGTPSDDSRRCSAARWSDPSYCRIQTKSMEISIGTPKIRPSKVIRCLEFRESSPGCQAFSSFGHIREASTETRITPPTIRSVITIEIGNTTASSIFRPMNDKTIASPILR
jgi:hypothetical protein